MNEKTLKEVEREFDYAILNIDDIEKEYQELLLEEKKKLLEDTTEINIGNDKYE